MRESLTPVVVMAAVALAAAAGCSPTSSSTTRNGRMVVVAAENVWGNVAEQIGGSHVQVTSIISDPNADPHLFEADARNAEAVASARVVIVNGAGYDSFMGQLLGSTSGTRTVVTVADVGHKVGSHANPHLWYDVGRVRAVAVAIEHAYDTAQPAHAVEFAANERRFEAALQPLDATIATIRARYSHAPVAYTERVPGYLLAAAGLDVVTPPGFARAIEDGNEPSAADADRMQQLVSRGRIAVLLYNSQATSAVTHRIRADARAAGIPIVAVTETMPPTAASYQAWQLDQARALLAALARAEAR